MLFLYVRHGDPIYSPDSLTELGVNQAEALSKRLSLYGIDEIYASSSNRAQLTAKPTCEKLGKQMKILDFANEDYTWKELTIPVGDGLIWLFQHRKFINLLASKEIRDLGDRWFDHPEIKKFNFEKGINRVYDEVDKFMADLGYEHIRFTGKYKAVKPNDKRVALFAHHGFGLAFFSCLLDIPYPQMANHFDICHSGLTVIDFQENEGYAVPKILTLSSDSHLYKEGVERNYNTIFGADYEEYNKRIKF